MTAPVSDLDASEVLLGLNNGAGIYIAPAGTPAPADLTTAWADPWQAVGYISDDGVTLSSSTDSDTLTPWQSTSPIRTIITGKSITMQFVMWETNPLTMGVWFDVTPPVAVGDVLSFDVRSDAGGLLYAVGLDVKDGDTVFRVVFGRAQLSDTGDVTISRGSAIGWDTTLSALDDGGRLAQIIMTAAGGTKTLNLEASQGETPNTVVATTSEGDTSTPAVNTSKAA